MAETQKCFNLFFNSLPSNAQQPLQAELRHAQESGVFLAQQLAALAGYHVGGCQSEALGKLSSSEILTPQQAEHIRGAIRSLFSGVDLSMTAVAHIVVSSPFLIMSCCGQFLFFSTSAPS